MKAAKNNKKKQQRTEDSYEEDEPVQDNINDLPQIEKDCAKQNFQFYDKNNVGFVQRFELEMIL